MMQPSIKPADEHSAGDIIARIGSLTRMLRDSLRELGLEENTIVIFSSDNGAAWEEEDVLRYAHQSNWGRRGEKGDAWDGGHHVPLIVKWPQRIAASNVSDATVGLVDLFATLADLTGQTLPEGHAEDSFSFLPILEGNVKAKTRDHIIYLSGSGKLAIKQGKWKFIDGLGSCGFTYPARVEPGINGPKGQLYDMENDPLERNNLYLSQPDKVKEMKMLLDRLVEAGYSREY